MAFSQLIEELKKYHLEKKVDNQEINEPILFPWPDRRQTFAKSKVCHINKRSELKKEAHVLIANNNTKHRDSSTLLKEVFSHDESNKFHVTIKQNMISTQQIELEVEKLLSMQPMIFPVLIFLNIALEAFSLNSAIYNDDSPTISNIINLFRPENAPHLSCRPKLLIFQTSTNRFKQKPILIFPCIEFDVFILFSPYPGFIVPNDINKGLWYIYDLCQLIFENTNNYHNNSQPNFERLVKNLNDEYRIKIDGFYLSTKSKSNKMYNAKMFTSKESVHILEQVLRTPILGRKMISRTPSCKRKEVHLPLKINQYSL